MKKTIITAFSILAFTALTTGSCTSTPKQGKLLRHVAGYDCRPDLRPQRCSLATYHSLKQWNKHQAQPIRTAYDQTLTQGAATLTLRDYGVK